MRVPWVVAGFFLLIASLGAANLVASSSYLCAGFGTEFNGIQSESGLCSSSELGWAVAIAGIGTGVAVLFVWNGLRQRRPVQVATAVAG